jgi:hypothetical protein
MADYGTPITPVEEEKKNNTVLIIVIVLLVFLFCCCCLIFLILAWSYGDDIVYEWENLSLLASHLFA